MEILILEEDKQKGRVVETTIRLFTTALMKVHSALLIVKAALAVETRDQPSDHTCCEQDASSDGLHGAREDLSVGIKWFE